MSYKVSAGENSDYMNDEERRTVGIYDDAEEALAACRYVIERSLRELHDDGMAAAELFRLWGIMGEDAWVVRLRDGLPEAEFSGQDFARRRSADICQAP